MVATGGPQDAGLPVADVTDRMALFGRLFCEHLGLSDPAQVLDAASAVEIVSRRVPRTTLPADDPPVFEAAAFLGEWIRTWTDAAWVSEPPAEPYLQLVGHASSIVYLVPLIATVRVASTAGYDGLPKLLDAIMVDLRVPLASGPIDRMRVLPESERPRLAAWIRGHHPAERGSLASLWRRCAACSTLREDEIQLGIGGSDWEHDAATAAGILAHRPFHCTCGGTPGDVSRFLVLRRDEHGTRLADISLQRTHTRIACWRLEGDTATPLDATTLTLPGVVA